MQATQAKAVMLKGSAFTLPVLHLLTANLQAINEQLQDMVTQQPAFFQNTPVVIDLSRLTCDQSIDFEQLKNQLQQHRLHAVGLRSQHEAHRAAGLAAGFALLATSPNNPEPDAQAKKPVQQAIHNKTRVITQPVRSGQQIYSKGDLIVLAAVSHGAEILACGHIHVYGRLAGRALAGVNGDTQARIFCRLLDAELVSIAGNYCLHDGLAAQKTSSMIQLSLHDEQIQISYID